MIDNNGKEIIEPGKYEISIGGGQPLKISNATGNGNILSKTIQLIK